LPEPSAPKVDVENSVKELFNPEYQLFDLEALIEISFSLKSAACPFSIALALSMAGVAITV